jgi:uncharacterized protein YkwD
MGSSGHRDNVLSRRFRQIGVGLAYGAPDPRWKDDDSAVTATTDFGARL